MNSVRFEANHLKQLRLQPHELDNLDVNRLLSLIHVPTAEVWTFFHNGVLLAVGGYFTLWAGVVEIFMVPSVDGPRYAVVGVKEVKKAIKTMQGVSTIHRMQTFTTTCPIRIRFVESLGFTYEGELRSYTKNKENYRLWAMVRGVDY
jgi:hypothetical protein